MFYLFLQNRAVMERYVSLATSFCRVVPPGRATSFVESICMYRVVIGSIERRRCIIIVAVHPCVCVNDNKQTQLICHSHRIPPLGISATVFSGSTNARALNQVPSSIGQFFPSLLPPSLWVHSHTCLFSGNYFPVTVVIEGAINP